MPSHQHKVHQDVKLLSIQHPHDDHKLQVQKFFVAEFLKLLLQENCDTNADVFSHLPPTCFWVGGFFLFFPRYTANNNKATVSAIHALKQLIWIDLKFLDRLWFCLLSWRNL